VAHAVLRILTVALLAAATAACGGGDSASTPPQAGNTASGAPRSSTLPQGSEPFELEPANFKAGIDNPYWPMAHGSHWVYRETDAEGAVARVEVTVTTKTKTIMGIDATVVHDRVTEDGEVKEDTFDWYAQDEDGNVWYLGEDTTEYENGKVKTTEGSWEAGVDGALGGIIIPAKPKPGLTYREEYYAGHAEDGAEIVSLNAVAEVPYGTYEHVLQTRNFSPLEPNLVEEKFYARGVGPVLEVTVSGGSDRAVLLRFERGA
jgi:hypothetical protein